jgi:hypothetical protein
VSAPVVSLSERRGFFKDNGKGAQSLVPKLAADVIAAETPVAVGGRHLYVYRDGAYRPGGEDDVRARLARMLGEAWKRSMAEEVTTYLHAIAEPLWEMPPLDRVSVANGLLDVATGQLEDHTPEFLSPVQIAAAYDPKATCPAIDAFLKAVLLDGCVPVAHELAGSLTTPDNRLQSALMLLGGQGAGKSTLLGLLRAFMGADNVASVALHQLEEDRSPARTYTGSSPTSLPTWTRGRCRRPRCSRSRAATRFGASVSTGTRSTSSPTPGSCSPPTRPPTAPTPVPVYRRSALTDAGKAESERLSVVMRPRRPKPRA